MGHSGTVFLHVLILLLRSPVCNHSEFIKLPMVAFLAWVIFSELPGYWTWVGGIIIFSSTVYITRREAKINKSKIVDAVIEDSAVSNSIFERKCGEPPAPDQRCSYRVALSYRLIELSVGRLS